MSELRYHREAGEAPCGIEGSVHLAELDRGERAVVIGVAKSEAFCQLCSLGLNSGAEVEIVRSLSGRSLLVVRVDGFDIALRQETAATVKVRQEHTR